MENYLVKCPADARPRPYITAGKWYKPYDLIFDTDGLLTAFNIINDNGDSCYCLANNYCGHLGGSNWIIETEPVLNASSFVVFNSNSNISEISQRKLSEFTVSDSGEHLEFLMEGYGLFLDKFLEKYPAATVAELFLSYMYCKGIPLNIGLQCLIENLRVSDNRAPNKIKISDISSCEEKHIKDFLSIKVSDMISLLDKESKLIKAQYCFLSSAFSEVDYALDAFCYEIINNYTWSETSHCHMFWRFMARYAVKAHRLGCVSVRELIDCIKDGDISETESSFFIASRDSIDYIDFVYESLFISTIESEYYKNTMHGAKQKSLPWILEIIGSCLPSGIFGFKNYDFNVIENSNTYGTTSVTIDKKKPKINKRQQRLLLLKDANILIDNYMDNIGIGCEPTFTLNYNNKLFTSFRNPDKPARQDIVPNINSGIVSYLDDINENENKGLYDAIRNFSQRVYCDCGQVEIPSKVFNSTDRLVKSLKILCDELSKIDILPTSIDRQDEGGFHVSLDVTKFSKLLSDINDVYVGNEDYNNVKALIKAGGDSFPELVFNEINEILHSYPSLVWGFLSPYDYLSSSIVDAPTSKGHFINRHSDRIEFRFFEMVRGGNNLVKDATNNVEFAKSLFKMALRNLVNGTTFYNKTYVHYKVANIPLSVAKELAIDGFRRINGRSNKSIESRLVDSIEDRYYLNKESENKCYLV